MAEAWGKLKEMLHKHPWLFAAGIFVIGILVILWLRSGSGSGQSSGTSDAQAYYNAAAASVASGNNLQATQAALNAQTQQVQSQASVAIAAIQAEAGVKSHADELTAASNDYIANVTASSADYIAGQQINSADYIAGLTSVLNTHAVDVAGQVATAESNNNAAVAILQSNNAINASNFAALQHSQEVAAVTNSNVDIAKLVTGAPGLLPAGSAVVNIPSYTLLPS